MLNKFEIPKCLLQQGFASAQLRLRECFVVICILLATVNILSAQNATSKDFKIRKNDLKITILSIGSGSSRFTYERAFGDNMSAELTLGVIGWGYDFLHHLDSKGFLMKAAYKWNLIPMKSANSPLAGFYVKPEFVFADFDYSPKNTTADSHLVPLENNHTRQYALMAECGYQLLLKWFVFDVYTGLGPAFGTGNNYNYFHSFMLLPKDSWLAFTAGFRIGVAF